MNVVLLQCKWNFTIKYISSEDNTGIINIYDGKGSKEILKKLEIHQSPVYVIKVY